MLHADLDEDPGHEAECTARAPVRETIASLSLATPSSPVSLDAEGL